MLLHAVLFYTFAAVLIVSGGLVISVRNPVHSVFYLILAFIQASGLFILLGAEFLAMILLIVYIGAIAVLFLFVVMMLDINFIALREGFIRYLPIGALIGGILLTELILILTTWVILPEETRSLSTPTLSITNTHALGRVLYTDYIYLFQSAGILLLIAMIGAIVLTLRSRTGVHKQSIAQQLARNKENVLVVRKIPPHEGI